MQLSYAVAEIMGYVHVQILPGLLDYFEKISFSRLNLEKRKKRQVTALYKKAFPSLNRVYFFWELPRTGEHLFPTSCDETGPFFATFCLETQAFYALSQTLRANREEGGLGTLSGLRIESRNASV